MKKSKQTGLALMLAVLIVSVVSASAVYLIDSGYTVLRKTQQRIENEQFLQIASAVESHAIDLLYRDNFFDTFEPNEDDGELEFIQILDDDDDDLGYDPYNDSLLEEWAQSSTPEFIRSELKDDFVNQDILYITDLNRYFNINNLHFANSAIPVVRQTFNDNVTIFKELVSQINEDFDVDTDELVNNIIDWLDHDDDSRNVILFTEDDVYRRADSQYRPANRPIENIGELENVLGMTPELMLELSKFIVALPIYINNLDPQVRAFNPAIQGARGANSNNQPRFTKINVNTAAPELMRGLFALFELQSEAGTFVADQGKFQSNLGRNQAKDFFAAYENSVAATLLPNPNNPAGNNNTPNIRGRIEAVASVYSRFFLVETFVQKTNGISFNLESLIYKKHEFFDYRPKVIQRQFDWLPQAEIKNSADEEDS